MGRTKQICVELSCFVHVFVYFCRGNKNVTLTLSWNVIPNAGTLPKVMGEGSHKFKFPEEYSANRF